MLNDIRHIIGTRLVWLALKIMPACMTKHRLLIGLRQGLQEDLALDIAINKYNL